jgi:hypothetical protein
VKFLDIGQGEDRGVRKNRLGRGKQAFGQVNVMKESQRLPTPQLLNQLRGSIGCG